LDAAKNLAFLAHRIPEALVSQWAEVSRLVKEHHVDVKGGVHIAGFGYCGPEPEDTGIGLDFPDPPETLDKAAKPAGSEVIRFRCPKAGCEKVLKVSAAHAGKRAKCPNCGTVVQVPSQPPDATSAARDF
jgi:phage FluMu protein Com